MNKTKLFMQFLYENLKSEYWGDIDPDWLLEPKNEDEECDEEHLESWMSLYKNIEHALSEAELK